MRCTRPYPPARLSREAHATWEHGEKRMPLEHMSVRLELFVQDLDRTIAFYTSVLRFAVQRREDHYASLLSGSFYLGLGLLDDLAANNRHYFTGAKLSRDRGVGVEIVLEVDDVQAAFKHVQASGHPIESLLQVQNWGLTDFRIADPDGYYLRITSRRGTVSKQGL